MIGIDLLKIGYNSKKINENFYLVDLFSFFSIPYKLNNNLFCTLYQKHQLSMKQIAEKTGVSKSTVLSRLKAEGVLTRNKSSSSNPMNYRSPNPPFGYRVVDGRLVKNPLEVRICKKIIELKNNNLNFNAIAKKLEDEGLKNRRGSILWRSSFVGNIYKKWYKQV